MMQEAKQKLIATVQERIDQAILSAPRAIQQAAARVGLDRAYTATHDREARHSTTTERGRTPRATTRTDGAPADQSGRRGRTMIRLVRRTEHSSKPGAIYIRSHGFYVAIPHPGTNRRQRKAAVAALPRHIRRTVRSQRRRAIEGARPTA